MALLYHPHQSVGVNKFIYLIILFNFGVLFLFLSGIRNIDVYNKRPGEHAEWIKAHTFDSSVYILYATVNKSTKNVVLTHGDGLTALNNDLSVRWTYPCTDSGPAMLSYPGGVSTTSAGDVLVADRYRGRVLRLTPDGRFVRRYQLPDHGCEEWDLAGLDVSDNGQVAVVNKTTSELFMFELK